MAWWYTEHREHQIGVWQVRGQVWHHHDLCATRSGLEVVVGHWRPLTHSAWSTFWHTWYRILIMYKIQLQEISWEAVFTHSCSPLAASSANTLNQFSTANVQLIIFIFHKLSFVSNSLTTFTSITKQVFSMSNSSFLTETRKEALRGNTYAMYFYKQNKLQYFFS